MIRIAKRRMPQRNQHEHAGEELLRRENNNLKIKFGKGKRTNPDLGKEVEVE